MRLASIVLLCCVPAWAVSSKERACTGGVEAARIRVDVRRQSGLEIRSLAHVKTIEANSKIIYTPADLPDDLKKNAKVALALVPVEGGNDAALSILEYKPAANVAEWTVPFRVRLAVFILGPQGLDEKRVSNLVNKDRELISALADYADQTEEVQDTVQELAELQDDAESEIDEAVMRLDQTQPGEQALYTLLRYVSTGAYGGSPLGAGKRMGPVTMMNKASVGFFENAGGLFPGGGALSELKPMLLPDTDFRAAFVQSQPDKSLSLCVARLIAKTRNRQVYVWARHIINSPAPALAIASTRTVPIGTRSRVSVRLTKPFDWHNLDRADKWALLPASGDAIPVKARVAAQGRALDFDLRGFPSQPGRYRLRADWDWEQSTADGELQLVSLADLKQSRVAPQSLLESNSGISMLTLDGPDFQFIEKVTLRRTGAQAELAQPLQFVLAKGRRGGTQNQVDVQVDTGSLLPGPHLLALMQTDGRSQDIPVDVLPQAPRIDNLPVRLASSAGSQKFTLAGANLDRLRGIEIAGAEVKLDPALTPAQRTGTVTFRNAGKKGDRVAAVLLLDRSEAKRPLPAFIELLGPRPQITSAKAALPETGVALKEAELPAGVFVSFSLQAETGPNTRPLLACAGETLKEIGRLTQTSANALFLSFDPGAAGSAGCDLQLTLQSSDGLLSEPRSIGRVVRLPKIEGLAFTGEKAADGTWIATVTGQDLEVIDKTGWDTQSGTAVESLPSPIAGQGFKQTLRIQMPWPSPAPKSPIYVWLRGESEGRLTKTTY